MRSGLLPDWTVPAGTATVFHVTPRTLDAVHAATPRPVQLSYIQKRHFLDAAGAQTVKRHSSYAVMAFEIHDAYDERLVAQVFRDHLRRHETYHTWVEPTGDAYAGRTVSPEDIDVEVAHVVRTRPGGTDLQKWVEVEFPDIAEWDLFRLIAIRPEGVRDRFTLAFAVDHFYIDGVSLGVILYEFVTAYRAARAGTAPRLLPVEGYEKYAIDEHAHTSALTLESDDVQAWLRMLVRAGGRLPAFPLPLGLSPSGRARGCGTMVEKAVDRADLDAFGEVCRAAGASLNAGLIAIAALLDHAATGASVYSMLTPIATRERRTQILSVGWYTRLVPVQVDLPDDPFDFAQLAVRAQAGVEAGARLSRTPLHRVAELLPAGLADSVPADFASPMISYLDLKSLPGNDLPAKHRMEVYGSVHDSREVFTWLNRTADGLDVNLIHPDTPLARANVGLYLRAFVAAVRTTGRLGRFDAVAMASHLLDLRTAATRENEGVTA
ncbi:condensation domain-containing protein [Microbacterium sp. NPDC096154]|uniref:condensation domain-containing protein n=1 Tax=Microbacterium sp. NPDC096154 TaxID=3155549 RepID=UPI0033281AB4